MSAIAIACVAMAMAGLVAAASTTAGWWPLAWGRFIAGDFITMGPAVFVLAAALYAIAGVGLWRQKNWARHLTIVLAGAGLDFLVPEISSAVNGLRLGAIAAYGARIIVFVVAIWYLSQSAANDRSARTHVVPE